MLCVKKFISRGIHLNASNSKEWRKIYKHNFSMKMKNEKEFPSVVWLSSEVLLLEFYLIEINFVSL